MDFFLLSIVFTGVIHEIFREKSSSNESLFFTSLFKTYNQFNYQYYTSWSRFIPFLCRFFRTGEIKESLLILDCFDSGVEFSISFRDIDLTRGVFSFEVDFVVI